ncbi:Collagen alpha-5(VI) chain [Bulinus truncatus]|nr:Collagen alpha-5(VI) chain [Bulinus truncatus]
MGVRMKTTGLLQISIQDRTLSQLCSRSADIVFAIDMSYSIQGQNFHGYILPFVQGIVSGFDVGPEPHQVRVGAITFSDDSRLAFHLGSYAGKSDLLRAISDIRYQGGETYTFRALKFVRENMFGTQNGGRAEADRVLIVLTDGRSYNTTWTLLEADRCRQQGITIFAVGVGSADERELRGVASSPAEKFMFYVSDFQALESIKNVITENTCGTDRQVYFDESSFDQPCSVPCTQRAADIILIIDESFSIGGDTFYDEVLPFLQDVVSSLDVGPDEHQAHVGALAFGTFARILFRLDTYKDKNRLISAISRIRYVGGNTNINTALKTARDLMLRRSAKGVRAGASQVIVLLTDGQSDNWRATIKEAEATRDAGIEIFAVGVGEADENELVSIASQPSRDHVFYVSDFRDLNTITNALSAKLTPCA